MADGTGELLGLVLQPFSDAVAEWQQMQEELQQSVNWEEVPPELRELSEKRADYILKYGTSKGLVVREGEKGKRQITEQGKEKIQQGGIYMRRRHWAKRGLTSACNGGREARFVWYIERYVAAPLMRIVRRT